MSRHALTAVLFFFGCQLQAATVIEIKSPQGQTKILRDGPRSRIDSGDGGYMLVDSKAQSLFVVMPGEKRVMDMSQMLNMPVGKSPGSPLDIEFKKQGSGPRIAGYKTTRYDYIANGKSCGTVLASKDALEDTGMQEAFDMMERMAARADAMIQALNKNTDPCQRANTRFSDHTRRVGVPMRITASDGVLISEIVRIEKNAKLPANAFTVPAGYQVHDPAQMMRQMPNMEELMKRQHPGQTSPDAMQQLRRMPPPRRQ